MSSFVGLFNLDGAPCAPETIAAMLERLSHRVTPDGARRASVRVAGPVGLGCAVLPTTPQAQWELENPDAHQVLHAGQAQLWIASDGRLDNRAELPALLGARAQNWSDGRLILEAYARWGEDSASRLRGDFAYAIWDGRRRRLFCARDGFGVKPFYYIHAPGRFFAFASEIKALWCVPGADPSINPRHIADYLTGNFRDKTSTFHLHAKRLPPASWAEISDQSGGAFEPQIYWHLNGGELAPAEPGRARDEACAELVRAAFGASVGERMRAQEPLAAFLSGGLDSSSIAALAERMAPASQKPLRTLSTIFDRFEAVDERAYIDQTLARGEFAPIWMNGDAISPLQNLERIVWHLDGPSSGPNVCSAWAQYQLLQDAGVGVVLDGHGGDEIVFKGYERLAELLRAGRFGTAYREMRLLHRYGIQEQTPGDQLWSALLWHARDKRGLGRLTRPLRLRQLRRTQNSDSTGQLRERARAALTPQCRELLDDAPGPDDATVRAPVGVREAHLKEINGTLQPLALESLDAMAGAHAIETRCPFWERELAQLCLSLPADQKLRHGHNRYVMRRAMQGVLAPGVQWRRDKTDFGPQITTVLREREGETFERFFEMWEDKAAGVGDYLDLPTLRAQWQQLQAAPLGSLEAALPAIVLWQAFSLGTWLASAARPQAISPSR